WRVRFIGGAVAELAERVIPPSPDGAVGLEGDVMDLAAHDGMYGVEKANICGAMNFRRGENTHKIAGSHPEAELAAEVGSPGPNGTVRFLHDGASSAAPNGDDIGTKAHQWRRQC